MVREVLRAAGLRSTLPRIAVLRVLETADGPLTHADVASMLADQGYDRATVYRNLIDLCDANLAQRSDHGDHLWRFELKRAETHDTSAHAHFVCTDCGTVACLPDASVQVVARKGTPRSLERRHVEVQVKGVCDTCDP